MKRSSRVRTVAVAIVMALSISAPLAAQVQEDWDPGRATMTRDALEQMLARYEQAAASGEYTGSVGQQAESNLRAIRTRLSEGDFRAGDHVVVYVERHEELSDTFAVGTNRELMMPVIGDIPLDGVLRSELEAHLTDAIGRMVRDPVVRARSLIRMAVLGAVARQGYYLVPAEIPLADVIMRAGGPARNAETSEMRLERAGRTLMEEETLEQAIAEGRTLDQLSLRAGDRLIVPEDNPFDLGDAARIGGIALSLVFGIVQLF